MSSSRLFVEIDGVIRKMAHRPTDEIIAYLRESRNISADPEYVDTWRAIWNPNKRSR